MALKDLVIDRHEAAAMKIVDPVSHHLFPRDLKGLIERIAAALRKEAKIAEYLERRDTRLMARDGPARDTLEGCERALRDVYLIATGKLPAHEI